jgi:hypothetical protein
MLRDIEVIVKSPAAPTGKIRGVAALLLDYLIRERVLFPVYAQDWRHTGRGSPSGYWSHFQELEEKFFDLVTPVFAQGIAGGLFIPAAPRLLTFMLRGLVRSVGYYQMAEGREEAVKEAMPVLLTLLFSGITPKPEPPAEWMTL